MLELPARPVTIQSAAWSPWQSSVIAIGLSDGLVEIWDILGSTSRPQRQIRTSQSAITSKNCKPFSTESKLLRNIFEKP